MSINFVFFQHDDYGSSNRVLLTSYRLKNQSLAIFWGNEDTRTLFGVLSLRKTRCHLMGVSIKSVRMRVTCAGFRCGSGMTPHYRYLQLAGQVENYLQDISLNKIRRNPNSSTLQKAAMQIGKWPYFRILGGFTLHY